MTIKLPKGAMEMIAENYGDYKSENYGTHTMMFTIPDLGVFYFSYETLVAFRIGHGKLHVHQNDWGNTTGIHLNWIDGGDKESRLTKEEFEETLDFELSAYAGNPNQGN